MTSIKVKSGDIHCILGSVGNIVTSYLDKMSIKSNLVLCYVPFHWNIVSSDFAMVGMKFKPGCIQLTSHLAMVSLKVEHGVLQLSSHLAMVSMKDEPGVMQLIPHLPMVSMNVKPGVIQKILNPVGKCVPFDLALVSMKVEPDFMQRVIYFAELS